MQEFYRKLDLGFQPLVNMKLMSQSLRMTNIPLSNINPELIEFLKSRDLEIINSCIFYSRPGFSGSIHVDGNFPGNLSNWPSRCKLNFNFGETSVPSIWYDVLPEDRKNTEVSVTMVKTDYISFAPAICHELDRASINGWHLFEAGIPHNVINTTPKQRWCISFVISHPGEKCWMTFKEGLARLL